MSNIEELKRRIEIIEKRNQKVENDKNWETSYIRRFFVAGITYLVVVLFFKTMSLSKPFINAIVPTMGFLLSTLSISLIKNIWLKKYNRPGK